MDSANSGGLQSSSGGDGEYDSRAESISAFLNPPPLPSSHTSSLFDSDLSNYFNPLSTRSPPKNPNPTSFLNLDIDWSKSLRSDPNCTPDIANPTTTTVAALHRGGGSLVPNSAPPQHQNLTFPHPPQPSVHGPRCSAPAADQTTAVRNPKKRSRASRRAPTTVLTTDTTNFRAMVQEFTGIPAPPFTVASHRFPRSRLDLFGAPSSVNSGPFGDAGTASYSLLRPFAQKLQQQPPQPPLSFLSTGNTDSNTPNTIPFNFEMQHQSKPSSHQNLNLLNMQMQNPIFTFQSLLQNQTPPTHPNLQKYSLGNINNDHLGSMSDKVHELGTLEIMGGGGGNNHSPTSSSHLNKPGGGLFEEFGLGPALVTTHQAQLNHNNHMFSSSDGTASSRGENSSVLPPSWGDGGGGRSHGVDHSVGVNGSYGNLERSVSNAKLENYQQAVGTSSDFLGEYHNRKPSTENTVSTRSEGMVESWICSSD